MKTPTDAKQVLRRPEVPICERCNVRFISDGESYYTHSPSECLVNVIHERDKLKASFLTLSEKHHELVKAVKEIQHSENLPINYTLKQVEAAYIKILNLSNKAVLDSQGAGDEK